MRQDTATASSSSQAGNCMYSNKIGLKYTNYFDVIFNIVYVCNLMWSISMDRESHIHVHVHVHIIDVGMGQDQQQKNHPPKTHTLQLSIPIRNFSPR